MKYYLLIRKLEDLLRYKQDFDRVKANIERGKTPVFCELRSAKINMIESVPYNAILGCFMILASVVIAKLKMNETIKIAVILVINSVCGALSNYVFTICKHYLRIKLCKRLGIEPTEENIAVMESLEYQSV
jgi:hypothetical protein